MVTKEQALTAREFHEEPCTRKVGPRGGVEERTVVWRRNGATKTWKTRPSEWAVPVKWGLYRYGYVEHSNAGAFHVPEECPLRGTSGPVPERKGEKQPELGLKLGE